MTDEKTAPVSKASRWASYIITTLLMLGLGFSAMMKFVGGADLANEFTRLGYNPKIAIALGIVELICALLYVIPRTSVLGAILLTGYLGGATATHVRIDDPFFGPVIGGILVWISLWLRDRRVRNLAPIVK
jgi:hypothetical protein